MNKDLAEGIREGLEMAQEPNYFKRCVGSNTYTPIEHGLHTATHPEVVAKILTEFAGTVAADVIVALVWEREAGMSREQRMLKALVDARAQTQESAAKTEGDKEGSLAEGIRHGLEMAAGICEDLMDVPYPVSSQWVSANSECAQAIRAKLESMKPETQESPAPAERAQPEPWEAAREMVRKVFPIAHFFKIGNNRGIWTQVGTNPKIGKGDTEAEAWIDANNNLGKWWEKARDRVLVTWPDANSFMVAPDFWWVFAEKNRVTTLGTGPTEAAAWIDAAQRLDKGE